MVRSDECLISVSTAKAIRDLVKSLGIKHGRGGDLGFRCQGCGARVHVVGAHFELLPNTRTNKIIRACTLHKPFRKPRRLASQ